MTMPSHPREGGCLIHGQAIGADAPIQIKSHSLKIDNLKFLCSYLSMKHAIQLAREQGITLDAYQDHFSIKKYQKIMKYAMAAGYEFDGFGRQHVAGYSVVRIYKQAPILFQLINRIDKSFKIAMRHYSINRDQKSSYHIHLSPYYNYSAKFPAIITKASYFMTSNVIWRLNPDSKKLNFMVGHNFGLANVKNNSVSFNIEDELTPEVLFHEIIHVKHPDWNEKIVHRATALVKKNCPSLLKKVEGLKTKLEEEFLRIARDFARFDHKVGQIRGHHGTDPLSPRDLNYGR